MRLAAVVAQKSVVDEEKGWLYSFFGNHSSNSKVQPRQVVDGRDWRSHVAERLVVEKLVALEHVKEIDQLEMPRIRDLGHQQ
jgi:hypothetical protein